MRLTLLVVAVFVLAMFALCELALAWAISGWLYLLLSVASAIGLVRRAPLRGQNRQIRALLLLLSLVAALYLGDWTSRKPFLRDLSKIRLGMTEAEVRRIMGRYLEGTGWPLSPGSDSSPELTDLKQEGRASLRSATPSSNRELLIPGALVFRHSNDGAFNSDWGVISLSNGRVVRVEFQPD